MEAKELRIGNLIIRNGMILHVQNLGKNIINMSTEDKYNPIALTESWFIKFHAEKEKEYNTHYTLPINGDYGYMLFTKDEGSYNVFIHIDDSSILLYEDIKYVHQLQNIYFAISGEELTVKP